MDIPSDWTFKNSSVASGFDRHVREQLPWYDLMSGSVAHVVRHYLPENGTVFDIGSSTGNIGRHIEQTLKARSANYIAIDNSPNMVEAYNGPGTLRIDDIRTMQVPICDVAVMFLVLMFIEPYSRKQVIEKVLDAIRPGGCAIIVDKFVRRGGYLGTILHRLTLAGKRASGCSGDEIIDKELSLCGVQRPLKASEVSGWCEIFRFGEFAGYVVEK